MLSTVFFEHLWPVVHDAGVFVAATSPRALDLAQFVWATPIPVVVDFWAAWCGPCKAMAPIYERAAVDFEPEARFLKVDTEAAPELAAELDIRAIPTLMLFRNGPVAAQQAGALDSQRLRSWIRSHLDSK